MNLSPLQPQPRDTIADLEAMLALLCGRQHAVFTANATTALYLACLETGRGPVIVPDICCYATAAAAMFAGRECRTAEVAERDFNIDAEELPPLPGATLFAVHGYGHLCATADLEAWATECGAEIIEDAAMAIGGGGPARPVGSSGRASVLSFGHSKILDVGGGGALLCDDPAFAAAARAATAVLPELSDEVAGACFDRLRSEYYARADGGARGWFRETLLAHREIFLRRPSEEAASRVIRALPELDARVYERRDVAARYRDWLSGTAGLTLAEPRPGSVPWRFSFLVDEGRDALLSELRDGGYHASAWYPRLSYLLDLPGVHGETLPEHPVAGRIESSVVNLWTDPAEVDRAAVNGAVAIVREHCRRFAPTPPEGHDAEPELRP